MDFGPSADDYARHRAGFPASFFERVVLSGTLLDLGSGTGTLAQGFAARGATVVALDLSPAMLGRIRGVPRRVAARAEALPFEDGSFQGVLAGQCWHWFDGVRAAREARRVLVAGGRLSVAHFDYLAREGGVAAETERLLLEHHPAWPWAGSDGIYERWRPHLQEAGFVGVESFHYEEQVPYTREAWRGRIRACNGVIALGDPARIRAFDAALEARLAARFPDPFVVPHRVFVLSGRVPG